MQLTRRDIVKMGGAACLVAGTAGAAFADEAAAGYVVGAADINFTKETDVLIIGTGISGLAAGMEPILAGKKVTFAEKKATWGGDSAFSCWFMFATGAKFQLDYGYTTTIEESWEASKESNIKTFDYDWWPAWIEGKTFANTEFVDVSEAEFGCKYQEPATEEELPRLFARVILPADGVGTGYANILTPLQENLEAKGAEFLYELTAKSLIKDAPDGAVIGCRFEDAEGNYVDIKANHVVLATGGFVDNGWMMNKYLPNWAHYGSLVAGSSMGEGHAMAAAAGAMIDGMETSYVYCNLMGDIPNATTWGYWAPMVLVLPNGKRFIQEGQSHDAAQKALDNGYNEWWVIFDQQAFDARCVAKSVENNIVAHEEAYVTADTLEDLAVAMDVPVDTLVATFAEYDGYVEAGEDKAFGKVAHLKSLSAPYHALRLNVRRYKTSGGLMVGGDNQVLDVNGEQIPGLYACGAITTQAFASCSTCCATGYFVGKTIAAM
ncbi:MAG: FAD-binding protein [Coriobacteriales bacterium]|nr:FAD-binding protein [Coriobacteriales bacterium]